MAINGLVLQGGGALGAFELGVVECLLDSGIRPDVVSGVSIGAINATVLCGARGDPKQTLLGLWADLTTMSVPFQLAYVNERVSLFGNPGMYYPRTDYLNVLGWTSFYDTAPLLATLEKHVNFERLGPANFAKDRIGRAPRLILTATNLASGLLENFDSKRMQITPAHVRASGSLPPSFPPTPAPAEDGAQQLYWDGGLFDNTPLSKVIHALQESADPDKRMYVVNLFPNAAPLPVNIAEVANRMMTIAFSNKAAKDLERARRTREVILFIQELDEQIARHPELQPLKEHAGYKAVKSYAAPIDIVEITNSDIGGASDFSAAGIERRRAAGYEMAAQQLARAKPR